MMPIVGLILVFGVIILGLIITPKLKMNFGLFTMVFAFIIGYWVLGLNSGGILAYFPARIAVIIILFTYFSGMVQKAGIFTGISDRILYLFRNAPALIPWAIFIASGAVCGIGAGTLGGMVICGPIALSLAEVVGFAPILSIIAVWAGAGLAFWWVQFGTAVHVECIANYVGAEYTQIGLVYILVANIVLDIIILAIAYVVFKGWKNKVTAADIKKPEPFTADQKKVLWVVIAFIVLIAVPPMVQLFAPNAVTGWMASKMDMYILLVIFNLILTCMKLADCEEVIKNDIPWSVMLMVCGTSMLIGLLTPFGTLDYLGEALSGVNPALVIPFLLLIGGILTMFTNGVTVMQVTAPLIFTVASAAGVPQIGAYVATYTATQGTSLSPFSTGGAMALMNTTPSMDRDKIMREQVYCTFAILVIQILTGVFGLYNWMLP